MPIHLQFTLTLEDYVNAQFLYTRRSWWMSLNYFLYLYGFPALGLLGLLSTIYLFQIGTQLYSMIAVLAASLFLICYRPYYFFRLKRCYTQTRIGSGESSYDFDETLIRLEENNAMSEIKWAAVRSIAEDKNTFLIYIARAKAIMVPKRVCPEPQLTELRELCQRGIAARAALAEAAKS